MSQQVVETARTESFTELFRSLTSTMEQVIKGKRDVIQLTLLSMLAEGHVLLEDAPGVGKTTLGKALAAAIDVPFGRVQFTPDLLPSDVVGVSIWNRSTDQFEFRPGPVFNSIVLADEVNRASPKTQSALLEAMAERQVTTDGVSRPLSRPFMVIATQNPLEHAGTYPLPESQLDRFLVKVSVGYPGREAELEILEAHGERDVLSEIHPTADARRIGAMVKAVRSVHVSPAIRSYLFDLSDATRNHPALALGASPRATLALQRIAQARAGAAGRTYVTPDDIKALAPHVFPHRLIVDQSSQLRGATAERIVDEILQAVPAGVS